MNIDPQNFLRHLLKEKFDAYVTKNAAYSLKAYAKKLGTSSGALSEILSGKRAVTLDKALLFCSALELDNSIMRRMRDLYASSNHLQSLKNFHDSCLQEELLSDQNYKFMSDWRYFSIMALLRIEGEVNSLSSIANRLSLVESEVKILIEELIEEKLVTVSAEGRFLPSSSVYRTPDDFPKELMDKRILQSLEGTVKAHQSNDLWHNAFYSTVRVDVTKLDVAMKMIEEFGKRLSVFLSSENTSEVFELNINLFSRTKMERDAQD